MSVRCFQLCTLYVFLFQPGSVRLTLDSDGGHYESGRVTIPNGTYEGQLVIGDSFVYPVKKFTVSKTDDIVVLQFDVKPGSGSEGTLLCS